MDYLETKLEAAEKERDEYKKWWLHVVVEKGEQSDKLHTATTLLSTMAGALELLGNKERYECICFNCEYETDKYIEIDEHPKECGDMVKPWDIAATALAAYKEWGK